jgi:cytochrome c oxidase assembly protein subunit 11
MSEVPATRKPSRAHGLRLVVVVVAMFGFGFALGPLYSAICKATGINGKYSGEQASASSATAMAVDTSRTVKVLFVTTVNGGRPWEFHSEQTSIDVHPGEAATVNFWMKNTQDHDVIAQAVPNIAPWEAAKHLKKTECFCFNNQSFKAGEGRDMPVRFVLDPELPSDVDTVTLSYTFFDVTETAAKPTAANRQG